MLANRHRGIICHLLAGVFSLVLFLPRPALAAQASYSALEGGTGSGRAQPAVSAPAGDEADLPAENPYDASQCTFRAWELADQAGHRLPHFAGNATDWRAGAIEHGYRVADALTDKSVNSVAVWGSYVGGTFDAGHVAWVVEVRGDEFRVLERNWSWSSDTERWVKWEQGISFIILEEKAPAPAPAVRDEGALSEVEKVKPEPANPREIVLGKQWAGGLDEGWAGLPRIGSLTLELGGRPVYRPSGALAPAGERPAEAALRGKGYFAGLTAAG